MIKLNGDGEMGLFKIREIYFTMYGDVCHYCEWDYKWLNKHEQYFEDKMKFHRMCQLIEYWILWGRDP